ncbi:GNAT family N-acetyltransferase [uncultured Hyphomonas sp.]|uniref:GNAT family N-acetyltransferase n=1 Tax=uncultured Hyphomonas sp. TaxID=225298 RepID=UPI002AAB221F|nr:GNAT family N-acetyltransferase [uncultured Hyphomonas sp.]
MDETNFRIEIVTGLEEVAPDAWNAVANPPGLRRDPFLSWEFLEALESSGAATPETGWIPRHILVRDANDVLRGAMPLYGKTHSRGEFVFDHSWADAFERAGGAYYPKLLSAVPFTPVTGRRRLAAPGPDEARIKSLLLNAAVSFAEQNKLSSLHINFMEEDDSQSLMLNGMLCRTDQQFHWLNQDYESFDDFLAELSSSKRKNLRKERARAQEGLDFVHVRGGDITEAHLDRFYDFYMDTGSRKWGSPYLTRRTFSLLRERMADDMLFVFAMEDGEAIAGALNMIGSDTLYGRYWGTIDPRPMLHFETCYYQAIDYAIAHGLRVVEAGAQGGHKLARGYVPVLTYSAHWISHPGLRDAVADYLERERAAVEHDLDYLNERTPFKKGQ